MKTSNKQWNAGSLTRDSMGNFYYYKDLKQIELTIQKYFEVDDFLFQKRFEVSCGTLQTALG